MEKGTLIINDLEDAQPIRAVQLADGRFVTEELAREMGLIDDKDTQRHGAVD